MMPKAFSTSVSPEFSTPRNKERRPDSPAFSSYHTARSHWRNADLCLPSSLFGTFGEIDRCSKLFVCWGGWMAEENCRLSSSGSFPQETAGWWFNVWREVRCLFCSPVSPTSPSPPELSSVTDTVSKSGENSANSGEMSWDQKKEADGTMVYANRESLTPLLGRNRRP
jgi:hypothetical protein